MASITQIRDGIKTTVEANVTDLTGYARASDVANLPAFVVIPRTTNFEVVFGRGLDTYDFDVIVLVSPRDTELAQYDLDDYVNGFGAKSIRQVVFNNRGLGLTDGTEARVVSMSDYGATFDLGDLAHVGARLLVRVTTSGTA